MHANDAMRCAVKIGSRVFNSFATTLGLHLVARKLLLISRPTEGRRLSWPEHTVGYQLAQGCLHMTRARVNTVTQYSERQIAGQQTSVAV